MINKTNFIIKDSGEREEESSGAVRNTRTGKGRYDLLPLLALARLAKHYETGAKKYSDRNWEKGIKISRFMDSGIRHLFKFILGVIDGEDHLTAAIWNLCGALEILERIDRGILPDELDDLPYILKPVIIKGT